MEAKICRVCLSRTGVKSVFEKYIDNILLCDKLMQCTSVLVMEDDGLPGFICEVCISELTTCYEFKLKCEASDRVLRDTNIPKLFDDIQAQLLIKDEIIKDSEVKLEVVESSDDFMLDDISQGINNELSNEQIRSCKVNHETALDVNDKVVQCVKTRYKKKEKRKYVKKKIRTKMGPIQCVICGMMASCKSAMEIHMRTHTGEKPFCCDVCKTRFCTKGLLKRHIETHHMNRERKFTCELCGKNFFRKSDIINHMRIHTDEHPYICPFCPKQFRQIATLWRHKTVHTGDKPFTCPICGKGFADKGLVKRHQSVHSDERKFSCHLCTKSVKSKTALNVHLSLHSNEKRNVCCYCGMAFALKGNLQMHIRRVHSEKSGQCTICLKTFSDLQEHMRKHTGEKPYLCKLCDQGFAIKRSLTNHMKMKHENASKYKCSIGECTKTFPKAMMLEYHLLKQHANHTPYVCQHCNRGFFRTCDLSRHLRISHMDVVKIVPMKEMLPQATLDPVMIKCTKIVHDDF